jgi:hypothetical protein
MKKAILVLAVCAALTVAGFAASGGEKATTVGYFAVQVSKALGYKATTPQAAAAVIKKRSGIDLTADLSARLTERTAARVLGELGVKVAVANPSGELSSKKVDQLATFVGLSASSASSLAEFVPPTQCQQERNHGACVDCCKLAVGPLPGDPEEDPNGLRDPGKECSKFCLAFVPGPPSESEPLP